MLRLHVGDPYSMFQRVSRLVGLENVVTKDIRGEGGTAIFSERKMENFPKLCTTYLSAREMFFQFNFTTGRCSDVCYSPDSTR